MNKVVLALVIAAVICVAGCGAMFNGSNKVIDVQGSPSGAKITSNPDLGEYTLPTSLSLSRKHSYVLTFSKEGYKDAKVNISQNAQFGIIVLDVVLTGIIGVVIDAVTGDWNNLSPSQVSVNLEKATVGVLGPDVIKISLAAHDGKSKSTEDISLKSDVPVGVHVVQQ